MNNHDLKIKKFNIFYINEYNIKIINKKYRNKNKKTEILSFKNNNTLGDIIICKNIIAKKKKNLKKTILHGLLHLLGYKHAYNTDYKIMKKLEHIIGMSGIEPPTITTSK